MEENVRNLQQELTIEREARIRGEGANQLLHNQDRMLELIVHNLASGHTRLAQRLRENGVQH